MIEFTPDGPFAEKADVLFPGRVRILGLGQTGAAVCDQIVLHGRPDQDIWVLDSDQQTIEASVVTNRHLLGRQLVQGLGCSGDMDLAREVAALEEDRLAEIVHGCDFLILVLGLGGATGVALAEQAVRLGRKAGAKVIALGVQPLACEGLSRRERSIAGIEDLRRESDSVLVLSSESLRDDPSSVKNIRHGFHLMHQLMAQTVQALSQVVCKKGLIQLSFADVRSLYGRYAGSEVLENCWVAHVDGDVHETPEEIVERLLEGPLICDEAIWKHVDHAIVAVGGTRDLGLSDVQELVGAFKDRLPVHIPIATSASLDEESHDKVRMTVLLAMTSNVLVDAAKSDAAAAQPAPQSPARKITETVALPPPPVPASQPVTVENHTIEEDLPSAPDVPMLFLESKPVMAEQTPIKPRRYRATQEEMQFEGPTRGRFEKTHETMYRGENLDQPTFRRRRLPIRL